MRLSEKTELLEKLTDTHLKVLEAVSMLSLEDKDSSKRVLEGIRKAFQELRDFVFEALIEE